MMYLVSYTLNPKRDATKIITALKSSPDWWHYLDETWLICTSEKVNGLWGRIAPAFINSDRILIVQITPDAASQGWLAQEAWDWFHQRRHT